MKPNDKLHLPLSRNRCVTACAHFHCWKRSVTSVTCHSDGVNKKKKSSLFVAVVVCSRLSHTSIYGQAATPHTKQSDNNKKEKKQEKGQVGGGPKEVLRETLSCFLFALSQTSTNDFSGLILVYVSNKTSSVCRIFRHSWSHGQDTSQSASTYMRSWRKRAMSCWQRKLRTPSPSLCSCQTGARCLAKRGSPHLTSWPAISG